MRGLTAGGILVGPTNLLTYTAQTTDGTTWVTAAAIALTAAQGVSISAFFHVARTDAGGAGQYSSTGGNAVWKRVAAAAPAFDTDYAAVVGDPTAGNFGQSIGSAALIDTRVRQVASGNDVLVQVRGVTGAALTWAWPVATAIQFFAIS